jgi:predicted Ser/Thr protein kinase
MELFTSFKSNYAKRDQEVMSLAEYLEMCKTEPIAATILSADVADASGSVLHISRYSARLMTSWSRLA